MKAGLLALLQCPDCKSDLVEQHDGFLRCSNCSHIVRMENGIPLFTDTPMSIEPWEKVERGPDKGTAWRKANWEFLKKHVASLPLENAVLDVGAGHGDFFAIYKDRRYYALDIVPYAEVDLVTDLAQVNPFKPNSLGMVILANVLEHVFENRVLLNTIAGIVAPGGCVVITVPFLLKVHQAPFDFARYTPFYLEKMAKECGFEVQALQGYYDTQYLLNESLGNVWSYSISGQSKFRQLFAKTLVFLIQRLVNWLGSVTRHGYSDQYQNQSNPAPVGYLVVLRKPM